MQKLILDKFPVVVLVLLCTACLLATVSQSEAYQSTAWKITASDLNVRTGAGTNYSSVGKVNQGQVYSSNGVWRSTSNPYREWDVIHYKWDGGNSSKYYFICTYESGKWFASEIKHNVGVVKASALNVRRGPGTSYAIAGVAPKGSEWAVLKTQNGWHQVWYNSQKLWMCGGTSYLDTH